MTKYPLFGQDSSPAYTSKVLALIFTAVFCLLFLLSAIFVKPFPKKPKYKTVQIVLSSPMPTPVKSEQAASAAPAPAALVEQPVVETPVEVPVVTPPEPVQEVKTESKPVQQPKTESKPVQTKPVQKPEPVKPKTDSKPAPKPPETKTQEPVSYARDMSDGVDFGQKVEKKEFNWSMFDDAAEPVSTPSQPQKVVDNTPVQSSFSGSAGTSAFSTTTKTVSSSSSNTKTNATTTSEGTNTALSSIANATGTTQADTSGKSTTAKQTGNTSSTNEIKWAGGSARKLIMPKKPEINFSQASQDQLAGYKEFNIIFEVNAKGYVARSSIKTSPTVSQSVLTEIADQLDDWWFEEGEGTATATLPVKIERK